MYFIPIMTCAFSNRMCKKLMSFLLVSALFVNSAVLASLDVVVQENNLKSDDDYSVCHDRDPSCKDWALQAECRKVVSIDYMKINCPLSCNYCNPTLERWKSQDAHLGEMSKTTLTQKYDLVPIYHGVAQNTNFSDSSFAEREMKTFHGTIAGAEYYKLRNTDVIEEMNWHLDIIYSDQVSYVNHDGRILSDATPNSIKTPYSPVDVEMAPYGTRLELPESCINRHPNCALWAVFGYCDTKKDLMSNICAPMCQVCSFNVKTKEGIFYRKNEFHPSPFDRDDMNGIFESIIQNRIVIPKHLSYRQNHNLRNIKVENRAGYPKDLLFLNVDSVKIEPIIVERNESNREMYREMLKSNGTAPAYSSILHMQHFLTPNECKSLLETLIFGVGVDPKVNGETFDDGFPEKQVMIDKSKDGKESILRRNSRVAMFPSIKDKDGVMRYSNAIERLLTKIDLLTGMNAVEKIEAPIIFEKYEPGDMQLPSLHFKSGILDSDVHKFPPEEIDQLEIKNGAQFASSDKPDTMLNARIFGMIVFLNGSGRYEEGGSVYFPNMDNVDIFPQEGSVVLFPTVASLKPNDPESAETGTLDEHFFRNGDDASHLTEDLSTTFGHKPIDKGAKYCMYLYFRRYEEDDRM